MEEQKNNGLQLELPQDVAQGQYANFLAALQENIMRYEQEFGAIRIPNQGPRTATPFPMGKGEA